MIIYHVGDATDPVGEGTKVIAHICNDEGGWGSGFVLALSAKWKEPEREYRQFIRDWKSERPPLGQLQMIAVESDVFVANMVAQHGYSRTGNREKNKYVSYVALEDCLSELDKVCQELKVSIHMPRIGCGLGGGSWDVIELMLQKMKSDVNVYDIPCRKNPGIKIRGCIRKNDHEGRCMFLN